MNELGRVLGQGVKVDVALDQKSIISIAGGIFLAVCLGIVIGKLITR